MSNAMPVGSPEVEMSETEEEAKFKLKIEGNRVLNTNVTLNLGTELGNLERIIVAIFDLEGFTNFFDSASVNKNIIVSAYLNGFLSWLDYRFKKQNWAILPTLSKFLGDGVIYIWETERQKISAAKAVNLMNLCWNMVQAKSSYDEEFLPEFIRQLGKRWECAYPKRLRVSLSLGHAVKYVREGRPTDYVSESINIASKLVKFHPEVYFLAHSDIVFGAGPKKYDYIEKKIYLTGINKPVAVFIDKDDYSRVTDKTMFHDLG